MTATLAEGAVLLLFPDDAPGPDEIIVEPIVRRDAKGHPLPTLLDPVSRALLNSIDVGTCWAWMGATNGVGYGQMSVDGQKTYVHRAVYEHCRGPIPAGLVLDHLCGRKNCFNPSHLEPVTQQVNVLRALREPRMHCAHGHEWTPENTYLTSHGARQCRRCKADRERVRRQRLQGSY